MDARLRMYLAELAGTFILVLVGAGTVCAERLTTVPALDVTGIALAEGFALAVALTVTFYISTGCLNPAITLMQWVFRRLENRQAVGLIGAQLLGAALAGLVLRLTFNDSVLAEAHLGAPYLKPSGWLIDGRMTVGGLVAGTALELFFAFLVTLAVFASLFDPRAPRVGGILVGLAQAAAILLGFRLTGGAANPARWFGPAVWQPTLHDSLRDGPAMSYALIYIGGPVLGAIAAAFLYQALIRPPEKYREHHR
jgi:aquaporin Z